MLPAIANSGIKQHRHSHGAAAQGQHGALPAQLPGQQQQHMHGQHRQRQPGHHSSLHQQQQQSQVQHSIQHGQPLRQQQPPPGHGALEGLQGHQLLGGLGSNSLKDRDGSIAQLMAEATSMSMSQAGLHAQGLGLQASTGSLWQESSAVGAGSGSGQMLPPLMGKANGAGAHALHSARRRSQLGQVSKQQQQQPQQQHHSHDGMGAGSSSKAVGQGGVHLASKAGMLQEQQQQHARSSHHGMQISSAR
jgi:hypothetical protein